VRVIHIYLYLFA